MSEKLDPALSATLAFAKDIVGPDLAQRHALAIDILLHAGRLAGLADIAARGTGDRDLITPRTWLQAAVADLKQLRHATMQQLNDALPHAAATIHEHLLENGMRCSAACSMFASAARAGVEAVEPREIPARTRFEPYPAAVRATRALPAQRRRPTSRTVVSDEQADQLAIAMASNHLNARLDERLHRDALMADGTIYPDADLDSPAATALRTAVRELAHGGAPLFRLEGLDLVEDFCQPLPDDPQRPTAILIAIDPKRDPYRASIVRSNSKRSDLTVGRILTGSENDLVAEWQLTGVRVYLARGGFEYEAGATCAEHPWGRTPAVARHIDQQSGRTVRTVHGGDPLYTWVEKFQAGKGARPSERALALHRATNACPVCALPSGPQITSKSRDAVDAYDVRRLAAVMAYKAKHGAWPNQANQERDVDLIVDIDGVQTRLGPRPEPVLEGVHYKVVADLQKDYVARAEALYTHRFGRTKDPRTPEEMRLKWAWIQRQPGFEERPRDRFTVAEVRTEDDEPSPPEIHCVGEPEREAENREASDDAHVKHLHEA